MTACLRSRSQHVSARSADRATLTHAINSVAGTESRCRWSSIGRTHGGGRTACKVRSQQGRNPNKKALVGSWLETVTFPPESGRPPLKSLVSFHDDGTMVCERSGRRHHGTANGIQLCAMASGRIWNKRTFAYTVLELISDLSGNLVGYLKVRGVYTVSQSGNEYDGTSFAEILDADGNVLFSVDVTNAGQRIQIELP